MTELKKLEYMQPHLVFVDCKNSFINICAGSVEIDKDKNIYGVCEESCEGVRKRQAFSTQEEAEEWVRENHNFPVDDPSREDITLSQRYNSVKIIARLPGGAVIFLYLKFPDTLYLAPANIEEELYIKNTDEGWLTEDRYKKMIRNGIEDMAITDFKYHFLKLLNAGTKVFSNMLSAHQMMRWYSMIDEFKPGQESDRAKALIALSQRALSEPIKGSVLQEW